MRAQSKGKMAGVTAALGALVPAAALILAFALGGCGFHPLYAPVDNLAATNGLVARVGEIPGRSGFALQDELQRLFQTGRAADGAPALEVTLRESANPLGIRLDRSAARVDVVMSGQYTLRGPDGKAMAEGAFESTASYETLGVLDPGTANARDAAYSELANQVDARDRAAREAAQRIYADAAVKLERLRRAAKVATSPAPPPDPKP